MTEAQKHFRLDPGDDEKSYLMASAAVEGRRGRFFARATLAGKIVTSETGSVSLTPDVSAGTSTALTAELGGGGSQPDQPVLGREERITVGELPPEIPREVRLPEQFGY
jgi:hypothetical protein